jgi:hypothetical protein
MNKALWISFLCLALSATHVCATTWDEPWHEEVVKNADALVKVKIEKGAPTGCTARVVKQLAGKKVPGTIQVSDFHLLRVTSYSPGHPPEFHFREGDEFYLLIKKAETNVHYAVATPTAGCAYIAKDGVYATYTHSYNQALVPEEMYEKSMQAIFQHLHNQKHNEKYIQGLIDTYLTKPPQSLREAGQDRKKADMFFRQHVTLECFRYFGRERHSGLLEPFLKKNDRFVQISAVRALGKIDSPATRKRLAKFLMEDNDGFARIMALWELKRMDAKEFLSELKTFLPHAPEEETGFGGNIMDPRVGTGFPGSVKAAVAGLIKEWESAEETKQTEPENPPDKK